MPKFKKDDIVRFIGDKADYRVIEENGWVGAHGTYELFPVKGDGPNIDFVPERLLELVPVPLKDYEIAKDDLGGIYIHYKGRFYEAVHELMHLDFMASSYDESDLVKPIKGIGHVVLD